MKMYFKKDKDHDGKLRVVSQFEKFYVTEEPLRQTATKDIWRQKLSYQMCLVLISLLSGLYSYLKVAKDIETEVAVQTGLGVLKNVSDFAWLTFTIYNLTVLIYYRRSCWDSLISGFRSLRLMLSKCGRISSNKSLETEFSLRLVSSNKANLGNHISTTKEDANNHKDVRVILESALETVNHDVAKTKYQDVPAHKESPVHTYVSQDPPRKYSNQYLGDNVIDSFPSCTNSSLEQNEPIYVCVS